MRVKSIACDVVGESSFQHMLEKLDRLELHYSKGLNDEFSDTDVVFVAGLPMLVSLKLSNREERSLAIGVDE